MAQVVIFAPAGEDVSAGQTALEGAGHTVEVVEATAANLLHMAIGMVDGGEDTSAAAEQPITEPTEELPDDPLAAPAGDAPPEEPTTEAVGSHVVTVDGERIATYIDRSIAFPLLRVTSMQGDAKVSFSINESTFNYWRDGGYTAYVKVEGTTGSSLQVKVAPAKSFPHLVLDEATAKRFGLV